ncbi:MAG: hypothetical protein N4A36_01310, partial [Candidatus Gracilibacteria bacterium]|nr:hypothetical protein [Candidatus Gracilibacteria bacterium]
LDADGLYTHNPTDNQETNFSRVVTVEYLDTADGFYPDGANPEARDNRMIVTSKVFWQKSGYTKEISLAQTLTDYYGRTNAND